MGLMSACGQASQRHNAIPHPKRSSGQAEIFYFPRLFIIYATHQKSEESIRSELGKGEIDEFGNEAVSWQIVIWCVRKQRARRSILF